MKARYVKEATLMTPQDEILRKIELKHQTLILITHAFSENLAKILEQIEELRNELADITPAA